MPIAWPVTKAAWSEARKKGDHRSDLVGAAEAADRDCLGALLKRLRGRRHIRAGWC